MKTLVQVLTGLALVLATLEAQIGGTPATCSAAPASLTTLSIETTLTLNNLLTTLTPNVPPAILAAIGGGAQEIRDRLVYNPQQSTLTSTVFLVAPGSPSPTPIITNITGTTLLSYQIAIDRIYNSCSPTPSVMIVGTISASGGGPGILAGPFGSFFGAPAVLSIGYTTDNPPKINNVVTLIAGSIVAYSPSANGTVAFPAVPVTPPGSTGPGIVITPAPPMAGTRLQVIANPFHLDASQTPTPTNGTLSFLWTSSPPVAFVPSAIASALDVQFPAPGDYTITLTVTSTSGMSSTVTIPITFVGRNSL